MKRLYFLITVWLSLSLTATAQTVDYASHSVLSSGHWAKISVPETGIYELTDELLAQAGIQHPERVRVYGYGGALQPENLSVAYLTATDDLKEVPVCRLSDGRCLFFGIGPVNWSSPTSMPRELNHYANAGCYFLTESDADVLAEDSATFVGRYYPHPNDYHALYEEDEFSWRSGGRNLFDSHVYGLGVSRTYTLPAYGTAGKLAVYMSYQGYCNAEVYVNDSLLGCIEVSEKTQGAASTKKSFPDKYSIAAMDVWTFNIPQGLRDENVIRISQQSGLDMRLDYLSLTSKKPRPLSLLPETLPVPRFVAQIDNQDLHADGPADMVIIIPANRLLYDEAQRLAALHTKMDGLRVRIVSADELYNEFSSGTPDANAYRRYLKMLYDRAEKETDKPRYLLLMGDGAWDNRIHSANWRSLGLTTDDFLLCYESENSFSETQCFVTDDFYCMLDEGEGTNMQSHDIGDLAVGRLPVRSVEEARIVVDKIVSYRKNEYAGPWQNLVCIMGDDGDNNRHMRDADRVADMVENDDAAYNVTKIYWDAYHRDVTSTGAYYPEVTRLIRQQMQQGALVMNYTGHGSAIAFSHEMVLYLSDFKKPSSQCLPLWVTASCGTVPFDGTAENIGEATVLNPDGGAIAFFGTVHTVYATKNMPINRSFMHYVMGTKDGRRITLGEAARMAKTEVMVSSIDLVENKLQYVLLGDPALALATPCLPLVIDEVSSDSGGELLSVGEEVTVKGNIPGYDKFNGVATISVLDAVEHTVCRMNDGQMESPFEFNHRPNTVFKGRTAVVDGHFTFRFKLPIDISYAESAGQILVYALSDDRTLEAHGEYSGFVMGGGDDMVFDKEGPIVSCYLNYPEFMDGGRTDSSPTFHAQLQDDNGINASGCGIGHDMELIIDDELMYTYNLNSYFLNELGDYGHGEVEFQIPALPDGEHHLVFRAWDIFNNSSVATLNFVVESGYTPSGISEVVIDDDSLLPQPSTIHHSPFTAVYDAAGRLVSSNPSSSLHHSPSTIHHSPLSKGLYIVRTKQGTVKKIMVRGNK